MRCKGVREDVATLSGAKVRRGANSTMTASPANLKTKTSSPAERQVVDIHLGVLTKYNKIFIIHVTSQISYFVS